MKKISCLFIAIFTLISCTQNELTTPIEQIDNSNNVEQVEIKIIKKLENPYSVSNMKKAYESLVNDGMLRSNIQIEATHLYVRFLPKNTIEFDLLKSVSGYSMQQIEHSLKGITTLQQWRNNLYNQHSNSTKENLQELFDNFIKL